MNDYEWQWVGFRLGFFMLKLDPQACTHYPNPARLINSFFFFFCTQTRSIGPHGARKPGPKITNPEIKTNLKSQTTEYICNFLGNSNIFLPSKRMPRSNKPICTKNPTNYKSQKFCKPRNKFSKSENPSNKTLKKPNKFG